MEFYYGTSNNNGNVLSQKIARPGFFDEQHYRYDGVNRLGIATEGVAPSGPDGCPGGEKWCRDYGYDAFGNRAIVGNSGPTLPQATPTSLGAFSTATNRLTAGGYDNAGNLTGHTGLAQEILYDAENRMVEFSGPAGLQREGSYAYDGEGRRVLAVSTLGGTSTTTVYVYDAFGNLAAEYATQAPSNPGTFYRTTDHLGSTRLITKADGTIDASGGCLDFYPFGEQIDSGTGNRGSVPCYGGTTELKQKFTAKERDTESGLDYFGARYYGSSLGRFTSVDPENAGALLSDPQSWNGYAYVTNRPLTLTDPDGRCPWCVGAIVGAVTDVAIQVAVDGRSLDEIDLGSVAISAAAGATGVGIATKLTKLGKVARVGLELGSDVVASGAQQLNETGEVSLGTTILDVSGGKIAGDVAGSIAQKSASGSRGVQLLKKEADRKTRIANKAEARGNQSSANRRNRQAAAVTQQANDVVARRTAAASVSSSQAGSKVVTQTAEEVKRRLEEEEKNR